MDMTPVPKIVAESPKVTDHTFYLWDETDERTRTLCGVGCAFGPEDHISEADFIVAERVRDAAPAMLAALKQSQVALSNALETGTITCRCWGAMGCDAHEWLEDIGAALAAAQAPAEAAP